MSGSLLVNVSTLFCVLVTLCAFTFTAVWNLQTGHCYEKLKFRHHNPILCVKIDKALVMSSCDKGLVKMWGMETASLLKVRWSVLCQVNVFIDLFTQKASISIFSGVLSSGQKKRCTVNSNKGTWNWVSHFSRFRFECFLSEMDTVLPHQSPCLPGNRCPPELCKVSVLRPVAHPVRWF